MKPAQGVSQSLCPRCKVNNQCGQSRGNAADCWCRQLPPLPQPDWLGSCYCPACLAALTAPAEQGKSEQTP